MDIAEPTSIDELNFFTIYDTIKIISIFLLKIGLKNID